MKRAWILCMLLCAASSANAASQMRTFLTDCAYGTIGGALVGLASIAISDNPGGKINNVARGASLGLYAGIGFGLYEINHSSNANVDTYHMHFEPKFLADGKADGVVGILNFPRF